MVMSFLERTGYSCSWTIEDISHAVERANNGEVIDWAYWGTISNITPSQAAKLYWCIDPIKWPENKFNQGTLPDELRIKIECLNQFLENRSSTWSLSYLVSMLKELGGDNFPFGMIETVKKLSINQIEKNEVCSNFKPDAESTFSWIKAAQLLEIPKNECGNNWRGEFNSYDLALLQEPENINDRNAFRELIEIELQGRLKTRMPEYRDVGRIDGLTELKVSVNINWYNNSDMKKDYITENFYQSYEVSGLFEKLNKAPSEHLKAWFSAMSKHDEYASIKLYNSYLIDSPEFLYSDNIIDLWAKIPNKFSSWNIKKDLENKIEQAIITNNLDAIVEIRKDKFDDGFEELTDKNRIRKINNGWLGDKYIRYTIYKDKLQAWLEKSNQWPLPDDCLLVKWFDSEAQAERVGDNDKTKAKARKTLKPLVRETNEGLLLIDQMTRFYNVKYLDELPTAKAWGKIVSGEFKSDLIKQVSEVKKFIELHGGEKLSKIDFSDKYRRRFK